MLSPDHVLQNPDEASIVTYLTQFYYSYPVVEEEGPGNEALEKLRRLVLEAIEQIQLHLFDVELSLEFIQSVERVSEYKPLIRQIISMSKVKKKK